MKKIKHRDGTCLCVDLFSSAEEGLNINAEAKIAAPNHRIASESQRKVLWIAGKRPHPFVLFFVLFALDWHRSVGEDSIPVSSRQEQKALALKKQASISKLTAYWVDSFPGKPYRIHAIPGDNYEQLQQALAFVIKNPGYYLAPEPGIYSYSRPLIAAIIQGNDYGQVSFSIIGPQSAKNAPDPRLAIFAPSFANTPAIIIQKAKGVKIQNIYFKGAYSKPLSITPYAMQTMRLIDWYDGTTRMNRFTPACGAAIDPYEDPANGFGEMYPGQEKMYLKGMGRGGSTGVDFVGCKFTGFPVGILYEPGSQQNGDMCNIIDCTIEYCMVGLSFCQDQTKGNYIRNLRSWGGVHTLIDCNFFGRGTGTMPFIDGMNLAGGIYQIFNCSSGRFTGGAQNIYGEMIFKIGIIGGPQPPSIRDCTFDFMDFGFAPDFIIYGNANFEGCQFRIYNGQVNKLNFSGFRGKFRDGAMEDPMTKSVMNGGVGFGIPKFENVYMMNQHWTWQNGNAVARPSYIGQQTVTLNNNYTASMNAAGLKIGDYVLAGEEGIKYYDDGVGTQKGYNLPTVQVGRVKEINGNKAILDQVSISMIALNGKPLQLFKN